jgi:hypothetical protein
LAQQSQSSSSPTPNPTQGHPRSFSRFSENRVSHPTSRDATIPPRTTSTKPSRDFQRDGAYGSTLTQFERPNSPSPSSPKFESYAHYAHLQQLSLTDRSSASSHPEEESGGNGNPSLTPGSRRSRKLARAASRRAADEHSASPPREYLPLDPILGIYSPATKEFEATRWSGLRTSGQSSRMGEVNLAKSSFRRKATGRQQPSRTSDIEDWNSPMDSPTSRRKEDRAGSFQDESSLNASRSARPQASAEDLLYFPGVSPRRREPGVVFVGRDPSGGWNIVQPRGTALNGASNDERGPNRREGQSHTSNNTSHPPQRRYIDFGSGTPSQHSDRNSIPRDSAQSIRPVHLSNESSRSSELTQTLRSASNSQLPSFPRHGGSQTMTHGTAPVNAGHLRLTSGTGNTTTLSPALDPDSRRGPHDGTLPRPVRIRNTQDPHPTDHRLQPTGASEPAWEGDETEWEDGWNSGNREKKREKNEKWA